MSRAAATYTSGPILLGTRSSRSGSSSGATATLLTVEPPVIAAVVFFHDARRKPSLLVGRPPPMPLVGWSACCDRPPNFCLPTSGDVEARLEEPLRFHAARPPNIGPWQPTRPRLAPARNVHAMRRFIPQPPCRTGPQSLSRQRRGCDERGVKVPAVSIAHRRPTAGR